MLRKIYGGTEITDGERRRHTNYEAVDIYYGKPKIALIGIALI